MCKTASYIVRSVNHVTNSLTKLMKRTFGTCFMQCHYVKIIFCIVKFLCYPKQSSIRVQTRLFKLLHRRVDSNQLLAEVGQRANQVLS